LGVDAQAPLSTNERCTGRHAPDSAENVLKAVPIALRLEGSDSRDSKFLRQAMTWARVMVRSFEGARNPAKAENSSTSLL
jgi:hypothetical protein